MYAKRVIPCLDINKGRVVKGINFVELKDAADPVESAVFYSNSLADELVFLDISASLEDRSIMLDVLKKTAEHVTIPLTVGGGIRNTDDIKNVLSVGAAKVSLNSAAVKRPDFISESVEKFGSKSIVVAIDAKKRDDGGFDVYLNGGRDNAGIDVVKWAIEAEKRGAGEILLTSMDRDGTKEGFDIELTKAVSDAVKIPVVASGGAGTKEHFYDAIVNGGADAVLAASLFHFREIEIKDLKIYLRDRGIQVKL